ncbi:hypothetical protein ES703_100782 [subsurface metagenome]
MKLETAIITLQQLLGHAEPVEPVDAQQAVQLGIEALQAFTVAKILDSAEKGIRLPSETD